MAVLYKRKTCEKRSYSCCYEIISITVVSDSLCPLALLLIAGLGLIYLHNWQLGVLTDKLSAAKQDGTIRLHI